MSGKDGGGKDGSEIFNDVTFSRLQPLITRPPRLQESWGKELIFAEVTLVQTMEKAQEVI